MDVGIGVMDKYAGLYIAVWIDMTIEPATGNTAAYKFTVILEIKGKDRLATLKGSDLPDPVVHIFTLL